MKQHEQPAGRHALSGTADARARWLALTAALLGWMFDGAEMGLFSMVGRPAVKDLLATADEARIGLWFGIITAGFLVGAATGGVLFGWLGDRVGRVRAMTLSVLTYAVFTGLCGVATAAWQVGALRFIAALGMGGEWSLGVALVMEVWPNRSRAFMAGLIGASANVGYLLVGFVGLVLGRGLERDGGLAAGRWALAGTRRAVGGQQRLAIDDDHRHAAGTADLLHSHVRAGIAALAQGGDRAAPQCIGRPWICWGLCWDWPGRRSSCILWAPRTAEQDQFQLVDASCGHADRVGDRDGGLSLIPSCGTFSGRPGRWMRSNPGSRRCGRMLMGAVLSGVALLGTWGSTQWAPSWADKLTDSETKAGVIGHAREYTQIAMAAGAIVGTIAAALVGGWLGRRVTYCFLCVLSLVSVYVFFLTNHVYGWPLLFWACVAGATTAAFYGWLPLYLPELFRTNVRATGQGFGFNFGRILAAIGVLQTGNLMHQFQDGFRSPASRCRPDIPPLVR